MNYSFRSYLPELLDGTEVPAADIRRNLYELEIINRKLGGHSVTLKGFSQLTSHLQKIQVCEIGCGGGDNMKVIENKFTGKFPDLAFIGIDINPDCISVADNLKWQSPVRFLVNDYREVKFESRPDIIFCSLFCHHFDESSLVEMFRWMYENSKHGFFINDLHRHPLAYRSIRILTFLFSKSYLVKHDAPLSVLRGFKKKELEALLIKAGITQFSIQWKWAFRWLIIVHRKC
jgi:2-polyprenyl-3-methyl-5-hydroxy-6-metoxy-1,4-benzoquinol methylase